MSLCKATSKRTKKPCGAQAVTGRDLCYHHGGKNPRGVDSARFKHGRFSKAYEGEPAERFEAILSDPELLSVRNELAALTVRLESLIARAESESKTVGDKTYYLIIRLAEATAKLRETEFKRLDKLRGFMTPEQGEALVGLFVRVVQGQVASGKQGQVLIDAIARDLGVTGRLLTGQHDAGSAASDVG